MKFILLACVLGCALLPARGDVCVDSLDVKKYLGSADTMWIVNKGFTGGEEQTRHVELKLLLKNVEELPTSGQVTCQQINTVTGEKTEINSDGWPLTFSQLSDTLKFPSLDEGVYLLNFIFGAAPTYSEISCYLFNQRLEFQIIDALVPEGSVQGDDCITGKEDTCFFTLTGHRFNPTGTEYEMDGNDDFGGDVQVVKKENSLDTFFVVFSGPTGINELRLAVKGSYKDERDGREIVRTIVRERTLQKYATPDLAKIFGFDTLSPDHLSGCANNGPVDGFSYGKDTEERYMYANNEPNFSANPKLKYTIKYYRRDFEHDEHGNPLAWSDAHLLSDAQQKMYVSDSTNISFLESGIYRVWMTAENRCGKDTLDTKVIFDEKTNRPILANPDTGRLIKIYRNDTRDFVFKQSALCLVEKNDVLCDTLVMKDGARYLDWEGNPKYEFLVKQIQIGADGKESIVDLPEDELGSYYREAGRKSFLNGNDKRITDSVVMKLVFYQAGIYQVVVKKTRENALCVQEVSDTLRLRVGAAPTLKPEILHDSNGAPQEGQTFCGIYEYAVPQELRADSNYYAYTAFEWKFGKGKYEVISDKRFPEFQTFVFDSLNGEPSYITLRLQNQCGWSDTTINFSVHKALNNIQLWLDSLPDNDILCAGREYKYHFKGELPEQFQIYGFGGRDEFETDSIITYEHSTAERFTNTYIVKDANSSCEQKIEVEIDFVAPPAFSFEDAVDFCHTTQEIKTSLLLKEPHGELEDLVYQRMRWEVVQPDALSLVDDDELEEEVRKDFPKFTVPDADKTVLHYWVTAAGGGDFSRYQGCYDTGRIELTRHPLPTFELRDEELADLCAKQINTVDLFDKAIAGASFWTIQVNGMTYSGQGGDPMPEYTMAVDDDSIKMKVDAVIDFDHPYRGEGQCATSGSIALDIRNPRIRILKKDTLFASDRIYRFSQIQAYVDTADITDFKWTSIDSDNKGTIENPENLFEAVCDFSNNQPKVEYRFKLSGKSLCNGAELEDILYVWFPETGFTGGSVSICDNSKEYPLWSDIAGGHHINGYFIKDGTLKYTLTQGEGTIVGEGKQAVYRLPEGGIADFPNGKYTIIIHATAEDEQGNPLSADLTIYVWPSPQMSLKEDIVLSDNGELVLVEGDELDLRNLADFSHTTLQIKWSHDGEELDKYNPFIPDYDGYKAYRDTILVEMPLTNGNLGCKAPFYDTLALWVHPEPRVLFRKAPFEICPGGQVPITPREPAAEDGEIWTYTWASRINPDVKNVHILPLNYQYVNGNDLGFDTLSLTVTKQITNYKGELKTLTAKDSVPVTNYREPKILGEEKNTLCASETEIDTRDMGIRTPYDNELSWAPQAGLEQIGNTSRFRFTGEAGTTANLVVSLKEEKCPDWTNINKTFTIRRLPVLSARVSPESLSLCDGDQHALTATLGSGVTKYEWSTTQGGILDKTAPTNPIYISVPNIAKDTVVLTLVPESERCTEDQREYPVPVEINTLPHDLWETMYSVCATESQFTIKPIQATEKELKEMFSKVEWLYNGEKFSFAYIPVFELEKVDPTIREQGGEVTITANAWLTCNPDRDPMVVKIKLNILPTPKITVGSVPSQLCQGESLAMDFVTFEHVKTWAWSATHGSFSDEAIEHPDFRSDDYFGSGVAITVVAGNGGCPDVTETVWTGEVFEAPEPSIQPEPACQGKEMRVWSLSEGVETYTWTYGNDVKHDPVVYYTFDDLADHTISLEVKYHNGCSRHQDLPVSVHENPVAKLTVSDTLTGIQRPVRIESLSESVEDLKWYVADKWIGSEPSFPYTFVDAGRYKVTLEVKNEYGCTHAVDTFIRVINVPKPDFTVKLNDLCDTVPVFENLTSDKYEVKFTWILGTDDISSDVNVNGKVPGGAVRYPRDWKKKFYDIGLVVEALGMKDTTWKQLEIQSRLKASIKIEDEGAECSGKEVVFRNRTQGDADSYRIQWGDGSDDFTFADKGRLTHVYRNDRNSYRTDTVRLYAQNACYRDVDSVLITLAPQLEPLLKPLSTDVCFGEEFTFANQTEHLEDLTVFWNFGDGTVPEGNDAPEVKHIFKQPGDYMVIMSVGYKGCDKVKDTINITIKGDQSLKFEQDVAAVCAGKEVNFHVPEEVKERFWQYEWCLDYHETLPDNSWEPDKGEAKIPYPADEPGKVVVALKAESLDGCRMVYTDTVETKRATPARLEFRLDKDGAFVTENEEIHGCSPLELEVRALGTNATDQVRWDFYDGASASDKQTLHTYREAENTFVKLTVTTRDGCVDSLKKEVTVKRTPRAAFTNVPGNIFCVEGVVRLEVENGVTSAGDTTYSWSYLRPGATDFEAWGDAFLPPVTEWQNVFGDIVLRLRAVLGECEAVHFDTIVSSPAPQNGFSVSATGVCEEVPVEFHCEALPGSRCSWNLGDHSPERTDSAFVYVYDMAGQYPVALHIENRYGCVKDTTLQLTVYPLPEADFDFVDDPSIIEGLPDDVDISQLPVVNNGGFRFTNRSFVREMPFADATLLSHWNMGDGTVLDVHEPTHRFPNNGDYPVVLSVTTRYGCVDSVEQVVSVEEVKGLYIPNAFAPLAGKEENPDIALFQPKGIGLLSYEIRVYDNASGTCVWKSTALDDGRPAEAWDGTFNGQLLPGKVYLWEVKAVFRDGTIWKDEKGNTRGMVTLVR